MAGITIALAATSACGGGSKVKASDYVHKVCGDFQQYQKDTAGASSTFQTKIQSDIQGQNISSAKTDAQSFLKSFTDSSQKLVSQVDDAGTPDVKDGAKVRSDIKSALTKISSAFSDAEKKVDAITTTDPEKFQTQFQAAFSGLSSAGSDLGDNPLQSPELKAAGDKDPTCQALSSSTSPSPAPASTP